MQYYPEFQRMQRYFQCDRFKDQDLFFFFSEQDFTGWKELKNKRNAPVSIGLLSSLTQYNHQK